VASQPRGWFVLGQTQKNFFFLGGGGGGVGFGPRGWSNHCQGLVGGGKKKKKTPYFFFNYFFILDIFFKIKLVKKKNLMR
jgi:hypothetical protein